MFKIIYWHLPLDGAFKLKYQNSDKAKTTHVYTGQKMTMPRETENMSDLLTGNNL